jgi:hypothetical protein
MSDIGTDTALLREIIGRLNRIDVRLETLEALAVGTAEDLATVAARIDRPEGRPPPWWLLLAAAAAVLLAAYAVLRVPGSA